MAEVDWDDRALEALYAQVSAELLPMLAREVEDLARMLAPVRTRHTAIPAWAKRGYVGRPGRLKASVQSSLGEDLLGPYADVAALWYGRFMDPKARQLHHTIPFLPSALLWTVDGRTFYL